MTCIMSISAAVALSSHNGDIDTVTAAVKPASQPKKEQKAAQGREEYPTRPRMPLGRGEHGPQAFPEANDGNRLPMSFGDSHEQPPCRVVGDDWFREV